MYIRIKKEYKRMFGGTYPQEYLKGPLKVIKRCDDGFYMVESLRDKDGDEYNIFAYNCEEVPEFKIELPEDLFTL